MSLDENTKKTERKKRSISDEIVEQREKLRKLEEKQKEQIRKERERTSKAVFDLLRSEKLDIVSVEKWVAAMPMLKDALNSKV